MLARFAELMYNVFNSIQEALISVTLRSYADAAVGVANEKGEMV